MRQLFMFHLRHMDWQVATFTTRLILMIIGGAAVVGFFCTLKVFFFVVALILTTCGWITLYTFFAEMAKRGGR
jgi:hypothetical protein